MSRIHVMPEELRSPTKISANLYFFDLVFIVIWVMIFTLIGQGLHIHSSLNIPYMIWNICAAIALTRPAPGNPEKRMYYAFLFFFIKDRKTYHPVFSVERRRIDDAFQEETNYRRYSSLKENKK